MNRLLSILLLTVELAWPFVYPPAFVPTDVLSEVCRCADAVGDCICSPCPCRDHGVTLRQPEVEE